MERASILFSGYGERNGAQVVNVIAHGGGCFLLIDRRHIQIRGGGVFRSG